MTEAFTRQQYTWQELTRNLDTAQELEQIEAAGDYVRVDEASDPKAHVYVRLGDPFGPRRKLRLGGSIDGAEFGRLYLDWPAQSREDSTVPWVKLIIARTYGAVRFQNPDPIELDITGLVKIAPHVIADGGRRADHRYELALEPMIVNADAVSYTAGDEVRRTTTEATPGRGTVHVGDALWGIHTNNNNNDALREFDLETGDLRAAYSQLSTGEIAHDSKRRLLAISEKLGNGDQGDILLFDLWSRSFISRSITPPGTVHGLMYDDFRDAFVVQANSRFHVLDAETGNAIRDYETPTGENFYKLYGAPDGDTYFVQRGSAAYRIDAEDGSIVENLSWSFAGGSGGGGTLDRSEGLYYTGDDQSKEIVVGAYADIEWKAEGYATAGACGGTGLIQQAQAKVRAEVRTRRLESGRVRIQGEVIRAALELHFGARMPDDYRDHLYLARFERTGEVAGAGAETWASAGVADDFDLELPQRIDLVLDTDLEPIY